MYRILRSIRNETKRVARIASQAMFGHVSPEEIEQVVKHYADEDADMNEIGFEEVARRLHEASKEKQTVNPKAKPGPALHQKEL